MAFYIICVLVVESGAIKYLFLVLIVFTLCIMITHVTKFKMDPHFSTHYTKFAPTYPLILPHGSKIYFSAQKHDFFRLHRILVFGAIDGTFLFFIFLKCLILSNSILGSSLDTCLK